MIQTIVTERLVLRAATLEDAPFLLTLMNEPSFIENIGDRGVRSRADAEVYIKEQYLARYQEYGNGLLCVTLKSTGELMGTCGLLTRDFLTLPDIGYAFLPQYWGRGYAIEAARAVIAKAKADGLDKYCAIVSPGNLSSKKLLRRLGLEFGRLIEYPGEDELVALWVPRHE